MERHFFPSLRCSHLRVYTDGPLQAATDGAAIPCPVQDTIYIERECVRTLVERDTSYVYSLYMAVKTNLLYDALLVPNLALEFYLGNRWSLSGGWMYAWWKNYTRHAIGGFTAANWSCGVTSAGRRKRSLSPDITSAFTFRD